MKLNRNYLSLWTLLAIGLVVLVGYDAYCESHEGEHVLKPSRIISALWARQEAAVDSVAEEVGDELLAQAMAVEIDTMPKNILFIGDSMLEGLSPRLAAYCDASGHTLRTVIWYSSTSEIWGNARLLSRYIGDLQPDYVFICLGSNELFVRDIKEKRDRHVASIIEEIGDLPYLWIGPPNWKEDTGINEQIERHAAKGCYFCSNGMEFERKKDGAHPTAESAIEWMDSIARWMPEHSAHPIRLCEPERTTARPAKVYVHQPGTKP